MIDVFTRWPIAVPIPNRNATTIMEAISVQPDVPCVCVQRAFSVQEWAAAKPGTPLRGGDAKASSTVSSQQPNPPTGAERGCVYYFGQPETEQKSYPKVQDSSFKFQDSRFKFQDSRFKVQDSSFKIRDSRFKVQVSRFKIQDSRFKVQVSRFKIQDSKFRIQDSRFKIQASRFRFKLQDSRFKI